jgi:hypothetical protein
LSNRGDRYGLIKCALVTIYPSSDTIIPDAQEFSTSNKTTLFSTKGTAICTEDGIGDVNDR